MKPTCSTSAKYPQKYLMKEFNIFKKGIGVFISGREIRALYF